MKKINLITLIALIILSSTKILFSQYDTLGQDCGTTDAGNLTNIPVKTQGSSDYLRCLIIYITFPDDTTSSYPYSIWKNRFETSIPRPINPYSGTSGHLIDSLVGNPSDPFMTRYHSYTLSDFFCEMSMGQYDVIGDEIAVTLPKNSTYFDSLSTTYGGYGITNRWVLNYLDTTRNIDWTRYDKWSKINNQWVFGTPDGIAEMIIINYREIPNLSNGWFWNPQNGGLAELGTGITFSGVSIGDFNGITAINQRHATGRSELLLEHEFSHKLFGAYGIPLSNDGAHINMGMMTIANSQTSYIMTPMERSAPVIDYIPINLINQTGIYTDTLPDYTESGISYKIKIPGTSDDYVWIANHQKKALYDGIARGGANCYDINFAEIDPACPDGKGLFVYREGSGCSNINQPYDIISAEGKYIWGTDRTVNVPLQNYHFPMNGSFTIFNITSGSRYHGKDEYRKSVNSTEQFLADDICSTDPNSFSVAWENRGDNLDAFNIGYDEIFSPYSNPSSSFCDSTDTGLTIALLEQNSTTGAIIVKIYYNNDATALLNLPPSKPKNVKVTKEYFNNAITFHPHITWDQNIEPDFYNAPLLSPDYIYPRYDIYRGSSTDCGAAPSYSYLTEVPADVTEFIDSSVTLYDPDQGNPLGCYSNMTTYSYKVLAKDNRGLSSLKSERGLVRGYIDACNETEDPGNQQVTNENELPGKYFIKNYPNPFNPVTNIHYELPSDNFVKLIIYDITGKEILLLINEFKSAGSYNVNFNGSNLSSGIYFYKIEAGSFIQIKKMMLVK